MAQTMLDDVIWAHFVCDVAQEPPRVSLLVVVGVVGDRGGQRWHWWWVVYRGSRQCWHQWWVVGS